MFEKTIRKTAVDLIAFDGKKVVIELAHDETHDRYAVYINNVPMHIGKDLESATEEYYNEVGSFYRGKAHKLAQEHNQSFYVYACKEDDGGWRYFITAEKIPPRGDECHFQGCSHPRQSRETQNG
jgi:hypothetical protein